MLTRALVIGYGSIGMRHARVLKALGCDVAVLSRRKVPFLPCFRDLSKALRDFNPGYVVIANRTSEHFGALRQLKAAGFKGVVMVEKPLFERPRRFDCTGFKKVLVGYNLRFHPLILKLRVLLRGKKVFSAQTYVGKDLRAWRPAVDYRRSYSASKTQGGGVLRDLSHELDYMNWLLGGWESVSAVGGHYSKLDIETEDVFSILMKSRRCKNVFIHMNYVDRAGHRAMIFNAEDRIVKVDLMDQWIEVNGKKKSLRVDRDETYRREHKAVLAQKWRELSSYEEAMDIMRLIRAAEKAAKTERWVNK